MVHTFDKVIKVAGSQIALLLGNGFSVAQAGNHFSYSSLLDKSDLPPESPIRKVFRVLNTADFEEVMYGLEYAAQIEAAYGDKERSAKFRSDANTVRESLIRAVHAVHPGNQFDIPKAQSGLHPVWMTPA